jgi:hypothetical protein
MPNAASLASTPHMKQQGINVVFVSRSESEIETEDRPIRSGSLD